MTTQIYREIDTEANTNGVASQPGQQLVLDGVSWQTYIRLRRLLGDRRLRITYDNGVLEVMTLSPEHERYKLLLGVLIFILAEELKIRSGGRVELGLGAGAIWEAIAAMGGPRRSPGEAVSALEEAIQVIRLVWSAERAVRFDGQFYTLRGLHPGPRPAHAIEIWLGALGPRMLRLTGRRADGWIPSSSYVKPDKLPEMQARINEAAQAAGRRPQAIRRCYNVMGRIVPRRGSDYLDGPADYWVDELTRLVVEDGMDTFMYWPSEDRVRQMEIFGAEVAPAVREAVARERGVSV